MLPSWFWNGLNTSFLINCGLCPWIGYAGPRTAGAMVHGPLIWNWGNRLFSWFVGTLCIHDAFQLMFCFFPQEFKGRGGNSSSHFSLHFHIASFSWLRACSFSLVCSRWPLCDACMSLLLCFLQKMWDQEKDHLKKFNELMVAFRVRPTILMPFWNVVGFALGMCLSRRAYMSLGIWQWLNR